MEAILINGIDYGGMDAEFETGESPQSESHPPTSTQTDPQPGQATSNADPCGSNPNCVTVTAPPPDGPPLITLGMALGHHFVDQAFVRARGAWNSLAGRFFRMWRTGPLQNPGLHKGYSTAHRLNSKQIQQIISDVEKETGRPMSNWTETDIEKAVDEVRSAGGDTEAFLSSIAENNPTARTAAEDIAPIMDAARNAYNAVQGSQAGQAVEGVVEDIETACESAPNCGLPPP